LKSPQLEKKLTLANERQALLESRIDRSGSDDQDRASLIVLTNELNSVREEILGLQRVAEQLTLRAPFDGLIADMDTEIHKGLWVNTKTPMAILQASQGVRIKGYVSEKNLFRFGSGANAKFIPDNLELPSVETVVRDVALASAEQLDEPYLALRFGGSIATEEGGDKAVLKPIEANYSVAMVPANQQADVPALAIRGVSIISGEPESFYTRVKRQVLKVLVREMGV